MPDFKLTKLDKTYAVDDGQKRGPLTMARVRFHPTRRLLVAQCADRRLALWDLDGEPVKNKKGLAVAGELVCPHEAGWIRGFDVHPRGEWIATGGSDRRLRIWKWEDTLAETPAHDLAAHEGWIEAVAFSPDGERIATAGADRLLKLWSAAEGKLIKAMPAHTGYPRDLAFTPDGKWIVTGGEEGVAIIWDSTSLESVRTADLLTASDQQGQTPAIGGIVRLSISHDSRYAALAGDKQTEVIELSTGQSVGALNQASGECLFARQSNLLAAGSDQLKVMQYEPEKFQPKPIEIKVDPKGRRTRPNPPGLPCKEIRQIKRGDFSLGAAFSSDDKLLAAGKTDGTVELWSLS